MKKAATSSAGRKKETNASAERSSRVYDSLRGFIVRGQLAPGTRIPEVEIARRLGVSRTPVRAALQRLEQEGYVVASPTQQARMTVSALTREDARELLQIVGELEGIAAREAAGLDAPARERVANDLAALNSNFRRASATKDAASALYDLDEKFHLRYVDAGAGPRLKSIHEAVKPQAERYIRMYVALLLDTASAAGSEHEAIVEAIRSGNPAAAQRAVQTNWRHAADRIANAIDVMGEQGKAPTRGRA